MKARPQAEAVYLERAIALASRGQGHTRPNPAVGAVIVVKGRIVGEGWHRRVGGDHAEVAAIKDAARKGADVRGGTIYVTLEPCSKPGRVGACTDAIAAAGLARVVYAVADPNPTNRGKAKRALAKVGIACERAKGPRAVLDAAERLIAPFAKHVLTGLPYVTVKLAMSLDGRICDTTGDAKWVSSARARKRTGLLREVVDVILVGAETVRKDDPSLLSHGRRNEDLVRAVVSRSGKLPKAAQVFTDGRNPTLVFRDGVEAIRELGRRGYMHVLCEGGLKLATSLAEAGLVDAWLTVLAPKVIGTRPMARALCGRRAESDCAVLGDETFVSVRFDTVARASSPCRTSEVLAKPVDAVVPTASKLKATSFSDAMGTIASTRERGSANSSRNKTNFRQGGDALAT